MSAVSLALLTCLVQLSLANFDCTSVLGSFSGTNDGDTSSVTCPDTHPHLMSCGCFLQSPQDTNADGCSIEDAVAPNKAQCVARNGLGGTGNAPMARCCAVPEISSCSYQFTAVASGLAAQQSITCDSAGYTGQHAVGCGHWSPSSSYLGSYVGVDPKTGAYSQCQVEDGALGGETYGQITCCDSPSHNEIKCKVKFSEPSETDGHFTSTSCDAGYAMTSCSAWSPGGGVGRWFVNNNDLCMATNNNASSVVYASAICCEILTSSPTTDPTFSPTMEPTSDPTNDPTSDPTDDPTIDPTSDPTEHPTSNPTREPTHDPTPDPTSAPTDDPTSDPTFDPTDDPTSDPTNDPSIDPTIDPTSDPTNEPTLEPTIDPTADPTSDPTIDPTADPTIDPTIDPTNDPTNDPSVDPTTDPTVDPTSDPTNDPSVDPTADPTFLPSSDPTLEPTANGGFTTDCGADELEMQTAMCNILSSEAQQAGTKVTALHHV